jgi:hypothetical protein
VQTTICRAGLALISVAVMLGLNAGMASAATEPSAALAIGQATAAKKNPAPMTGHRAQTIDRSSAPGDCRAINLAANVNNFGVGYLFHGKCDPAHRIRVLLVWFDAEAKPLWEHTDWWNAANTWLTYQKSVAGPPPWMTPASQVCIWVYQDDVVWPPLTSGCFPRNS